MIVIEYFKQIIIDLLTILYQYFGISIICSILLLIVWDNIEKSSLKSVLNNLIKQLRNKIWIKRLFFVLYIVFIFQRTLFNRSPWGNPLGNVIGNWYIIKDGCANYEIFENTIMFIPLLPLIKICGIFDKIVSHIKSKLLKCLQIIIIPFLFSSCIEFAQLFFRVGTFQLSDLAYNTLGGVVGGIIYFIGHSVKHLNNKKEKDKNNG